MYTSYLEEAMPREAVFTVHKEVICKEPMMYLTIYALVSIELHHHHHHHLHPVVRMKTLNILKKREAKAPEDICNLCETKN